MGVWRLFGGSYLSPYVSLVVRTVDVYLLVLVWEGAVVHVYYVVGVINTESKDKEKLDNFKQGIGAAGGNLSQFAVFN